MENEGSLQELKVGVSKFNEDPFGLISTESNKEPDTHNDISKGQEGGYKYRYKIAPDGVVALYRIHQGVSVPIEYSPSIKAHFQQAIERASVMTPDQVWNLDESRLSHIELASLKLARNAADGDLASTKEILDRVLGKPKQFTENTNLTLSLDDILNQVNSDPPKNPNLDIDTAVSTNE